MHAMQKSPSGVPFSTGAFLHNVVDIMRSVRRRIIGGIVRALGSCFAKWSQQNDDLLSTSAHV